MHLTEQLEGLGASRSTEAWYDKCKKYETTVGCDPAQPRLLRPSPEVGAKRIPFPLFKDGYSLIGLVVSCLTPTGAGAAKPRKSARAFRFD